ncbi:MAG TPA: hypothetical protein VK981_14595 [Ramlibacter sp.]|nr:hypothetical protein [Ramlibacter sp.]
MNTTTPFAAPPSHAQANKTLLRRLAQLRPRTEGAHSTPSQWAQTVAAPLMK